MNNLLHILITIITGLFIIKVIIADGDTIETPDNHWVIPVMTNQIDKSFIDDDVLTNILSTGAWDNWLTGATVTNMFNDVIISKICFQNISFDINDEGVMVVEFTGPTSIAVTNLLESMIELYKNKGYRLIKP